MGRAPRLDVAGLTHHVVAVGNAHGKIVRDDIDRIRFVTGLARVSASCRWECQAYCLMDTHLHLIVRTPEPTLGAGMRNILGAHSRRFNQRHGCEGHLWSQRYFSRPIDVEAHLLVACAYVVLNPVRAGLCAHPSDWRWSSYRASVGMDSTPAALRDDLLLATVDSDPVRARERWRRFVDATLSAPVGAADWTAVSD